MINIHTHNIRAAFLTDISFIGEYNHDFVNTPNGVTYNCHKLQLMSQTIKRIVGRRMAKPSLNSPLLSLIPEKTRNSILKRKLSEKLKAKFKLIPQQSPSNENTPSHSKLNPQIFEFLAYLMFEWKQVDDKSLHELALRNEPRKAKKEQLKP